MVRTFPASVRGAKALFRRVVSPGNRNAPSGKLAPPQFGGERRALVVGFFSTFGDIQCLETVRAALRTAGLNYDVAPYNPALQEAIEGAISLTSARSESYSHLIVVCGPCGPAVFEQFDFDIGDFSRCIRIGVNLTMLVPLAEWNPFHTLIERDSDGVVRPDLALLCPTSRAPVVGCCLIDSQPEYGKRQLHDRVRQVTDALLERHGVARIDLDTRFPRTRNSGGLRSASELLSVLDRVDVLITNRLHGLVFALAADVPVLAIDGISEGGKVSAQARVLHWPKCVGIEQATSQLLDEWFAWCLTPEAREAAGVSRATAMRLLAGFETDFQKALNLDSEALPRG